MKKYMKITVAICLICILLTGCGTKKLSGVYVDNIGFSQYEFVGKKVYWTYLVSLTEQETIVGTYTINDNVIHIEYKEGEYDGDYDDYIYDPETDKIFQEGLENYWYLTKQK